MPMSNEPLLYLIKIEAPAGASNAERLALGQFTSAPTSLAQTVTAAKAGNKKASGDQSSTSNPKLGVGTPFSQG